MFESLTGRLSQVMKTLRGEARLTETNIQDALREVRMALLEADVALPVVRDFVAQVRERALAVGPLACERSGLQFLDQTVECVSLRLSRNDQGRVVLRRVYRFEFTDNGESRRAGTIVMMGGEVASLAMEPYRLH